MVSASKSGGRTAGAGRSGARVLRIIGGAWRGRKLRFPPSDAIRPTPDRVRETLFNWLASRVRGARALDLFAGSGALGLEALSRGASHVTFVEHDAAAARELRARLEEWQANDALVVSADALHYLAGEPRRFELVFLDPPFTSALLGEAARLLDERGWLAEGALIYVESPVRAAPPPLPARWRMLKAKRAGEVGYHLLEHAGAIGSSA